MLLKWIAPLALVALSVPLIWARSFSTNDAFDEVNYHRPIIATMAADFPAVDVVGYNAAMAPGYHVLMAAVLRLSRSWTAVRVANLAIGVVLVLVTGQIALRLSSSSSAVLSTLPLAVSSYVVGCSVWLTTDNLGLLLAMTSLGLVVTTDPSPRRWIASGAVGAMAALVRQIHVWTAVPIAAQWMWTTKRVGGSAAGHETRTVLAALTATALPILAIGVLVLLWGGLLPPRFVGHHQGWNPAAFVFGLALLGVFGLPWLALVLQDAREAVLSWTGAAVIAAVIVASLVPSSYDVQSGRWGGWLWELVRRTPVVFNRSLALPLLALAGGSVVLTLTHRGVRAGRGREAGVLVVALVAWMGAQSANFQVWQRYFEPAILIVLAWLIALAPPSLTAGRWLAPLALATGLLAATILLVHGDVFGFTRAR
jgi:hypothetical protein